jgi:UDP-N-acetylglucosamine 2-epimerase (non-hydrolysing)
MTSRLRILVAAGTRPEAIKMAPVVERLRREPERFEVVVVAAAQHREMLDSVLRLFAITPDADLDLMRPDQELNDLTARAVMAFDRLLDERRPDWLLVQGDTTTAMCGSLAAFQRRIAVGHVEAGLRTGDLERPFPEELNRRIIDIAARAWFAPTERAAAALRSEGADPERIYLTGNTVVDALRRIASLEDVPSTDTVLITAHRRESFGPPMARIVRAIDRLAAAFPRVRFLHVGHPNPRVAAAFDSLLPLPNVERLPPQDYGALIRLLRASRLVLTDSGGIQEEAPTFGKPVLVLREKTERPEGIEAGVARLVGTDEDRIVAEASRILKETGPGSLAPLNPYGDGRASDRIADALAGRPISPFTLARSETVGP